MSTPTLSVRPNALARAVALALLPHLAGCAATMKRVRHGELEVRTEVSRSVFLEPVPAEPTVYLAVGNTAGVDASLEAPVALALQGAGYRLVDDAEAATYLVQVNVRQMTRRLLDEDEQVGDAIWGATMAGTVGAILLPDAGHATDEIMAGIGLLAFLADASTTRPLYTMEVDLRLTETLPDGEGGVRRNLHDVLIVSGATKVGLDRDEALPALVDGTARAIAGVLGPRAGKGRPRA